MEGESGCIATRYAHTYYEYDMCTSLRSEFRESGAPLGEGVENVESCQGEATNGHIFLYLVSCMQHPASFRLEGIIVQSYT